MSGPVRLNLALRPSKLPWPMRQISTTSSGFTCAANVENDCSSAIWVTFSSRYKIWSRGIPSASDVSTSPVPHLSNNSACSGSPAKPTTININAKYNLKRAGTGSSELPDLKSEFSDIPHEKGTVSMARSSDPNSANSQFFICFEPAPSLDRNYTVFGKVIEGMEHVDKIKKGDGSNGSVSDPDKIISFKSQ